MGKNDSRKGAAPAALPAMLLAAALAAAGCQVQVDPPERRIDRSHPLTGEYLGQDAPYGEPELFAPGIVSTALYTRDIAMTPDRTEIYWCVVLGNYSYTAIVGTRLEGGSWTEPEVMPWASNPDYMYIEPHISPDGGRFFFVSNQPEAVAGEPQAHEDIWVMDRERGGWGEPYPLGPPVNSENAEFFPSVTYTGTIYFTRRIPAENFEGIFRSRLVDGRYTEPERLPPAVNAGQARFNAFVSPDESYLIVPVYGLEDSRGRTDYYVCFRDADDAWTDPINLGDRINTADGNEYSPYVSPDGRYFFFMSGRPHGDPFPDGVLTLDLMRDVYARPGNGNPGVWWVSADFIGELRPE